MYRYKENLVINWIVSEGYDILYVFFLLSKTGKKAQNINEIIQNFSK